MGLETKLHVNESSTAVRDSLRVYWRVHNSKETQTQTVNLQTAGFSLP